MIVLAWQIQNDRRCGILMSWKNLGLAYQSALAAPQSFRDAMQLAAWARAQGHLLHFADGCEPLQPELAKELRAAARSGPLL